MSFGLLLLAFHEVLRGFWSFVGGFLGLLVPKTAFLSPFRTGGSSGLAAMAEATMGLASSNRLTLVGTSAKLYIAERPVFGSVS